MSDNSTPAPSTVPPKENPAPTAYEMLQAQCLAHNKTALFDALAAAGITSLSIDFNGYSDEGHFGDTEAKSSDTVVNMPATRIAWLAAAPDTDDPQHTTVAIDDGVESLIFDYLEDTHMGWEDGEGGYGTFLFHVGARTITLDYNERFIEIRNYQHVF